jgi:GNAT superfamily N-acetyltransferase
MTLVRWHPDDLARRMDEVLEVFGEAMSYDKRALEVRRGYITTHLRRKHFRAVASIADDGRLIGFGYGYHSEPGQWWHDQVYDALTEDDRHRWLNSCFEVVELHVRPVEQGHGVGEGQLRDLLSLTSDRTTLLSTPEADERESRAWRLYRRLGFVDVARHLLFPGDPRPFAVLGRQLPMRGPSA